MFAVALRAMKCVSRLGQLYSTRSVAECTLFVSLDCFEVTMLDLKGRCRSFSKGLLQGRTQAGTRTFLVSAAGRLMRQASNLDDQDALLASSTPGE